MGIFQLFHHPVVQRPVIFKLQRTDGVGDPFDGILDRMCVVVHRIDTPFVTRVLMGKMRHTVQDRVTHVDIGRCHVDFGPQRLLAVGISAFLHLLKQPQVLLDTPLSVGIVFARFGQCAAVLSHLLCSQIRNVCLAFPDQFDRALIHLFKIIGGKEKSVLKIRPQPSHVLFDGLHELTLLLRRIRIVKTEIELTAVLLRQSCIQQYALGMPDMEIPVGLRRESGMHGIVSPFRQILVYDLFDKIPGNHFLRFSLCCLFRHILLILTHSCSLRPPAAAVRSSPCS